MEVLVRDAFNIINSASWRLFAQECEILYPGTFSEDLIQIFAPDLKSAKLLYKSKREQLAKACRSWGQSMVEISWGKHHRPLPIPAHKCHSGETIMTNPIIALPTVEIGALTLTRQLVDKIAWMIEHPEDKTGITRLHDEAQLVMSASSVALLTTTTLKEAVQRKRSEFWHPYDLNEFRISTGEQVRDLRNGVLAPADTKREVEWRCVSRSGNWRLFTVEYETFVDEVTGLAYQFSRNLGTEAIEPPSDLILA